MAAFYLEEEEVWKCHLHPSKRRRSGICPLCLKERLSALCPDCANVRPCSCYATSSSSSSASSSFSLHFSDAAVFGSSAGGRISTLIDGEPSFRRTRSAAFPFFRSARYSAEDHSAPATGNSDGEKRSIWSVLWRQKSMRGKVDIEELKMRRSKSVAASIAAENEMKSSPTPAKGKGWYFPSPMKVFRHSKASKIVHERSPLHTG